MYTNKNVCCGDIERKLFYSVPHKYLLIFLHFYGKIYEELNAFTETKDRREKKTTFNRGRIYII